MTAPLVVLIGAGGHGRVLLEALRSRGVEVAGFVAPSGGDGIAVPRLGDDEWLMARAPSEYVLVNGVGSTASTKARAAVFERYRSAGFRFLTVVHRTAIVADDAELGEGTQVMAGAIVQTAVKTGPNVLVNTGAQLDHDCSVGAHSHIAPGAVCSGSVRIGEGVHLGVAAVVVQGITIGASALIGAGSVVIRPVAEGAVAYGNPAREVKR